MYPLHLLTNATPGPFRRLVGGEVGLMLFFQEHVQSCVLLSPEHLSFIYPMRSFFPLLPREHQEKGSHSFIR